MTALQGVRTIVFYTLFMAQTVVLAIIVGLVAIVWRRRTAFSWALAWYWRNSTVAMLRWIVGIGTAVTGQENLPTGAFMIAGKHQSDWDIFALLPATDTKPAFIAKRELIDIPFFGWAARSIDTISVDRRLGAGAIPKMLADAKAALERGCRIVIYPEGTRKAPLAEPDYRQGVARLYALGFPIVPVAVNSGLYWGRNTAVMWPGTARAKFLPPMPPGLSDEAFRAQLQAVIEAETTQLIAEAVAGGLARPVTPEFTARLAERLQGIGPVTT